MIARSLAVGTSSSRDDAASQAAAQTASTPARDSEPAARPVASSSQATLQRKVGFEFQTNLGVNIADKDVPIFNGTNWHAEGDEGDLEFITEPFNVEGQHSELGLMRSAVAQIAAMALDVENIGKIRKYGGPDISLAQLGKYGTALKYNDDYVNIPCSGWVYVGVYANPQVTGGVSLENIGKVVDATLNIKLPVNQEITEGVPPYIEPPQQRDPQGSTAGGRNIAKYALLFPDAKNLAGNELLQARFDLLKIGADPLPKSGLARIEGFLTYLFLYLLLGREQQSTADQTKYIFPLMSRTTFSAMFRSLPEEYRILEYIPAEILERSGIGDGNLFNKGMKQGQHTYAGPTRLEWLESIEQNKDLLSSALSDNPMVRKQSFGSPALGKYPELEKDVPNGVLIEIRSLPKEVRPEHWVDLATALYAMFWRVQS